MHVEQGEEEVTECVWQHPHTQTHVSPPPISHSVCVQLYIIQTLEPSKTIKAASEQWRSALWNLWYLNVFIIWGLNARFLYDNDPQEEAFYFSTPLFHFLITINIQRNHSSCGSKEHSWLKRDCLWHRDKLMTLTDLQQIVKNDWTLIKPLLTLSGQFV